jgi:polar amino acid transport system permease protein
MLEDLLQRAVAATKLAGLNYGFLVDGYERGYWLQGVATTVELSALSIALSLVVGLAIAAGATSGRRWLSLPSRGFIELTRNTPTLVQLYCAFLVVNTGISLALGGTDRNPPARSTPRRCGPASRRYPGPPSKRPRHSASADATSCG